MTKRSLVTSPAPITQPTVIKRSLATSPATSTRQSVLKPASIKQLAVAMSILAQIFLALTGESNTCYIASIFGQTSASGIPVLINSDNKLGTTTSSKRFKEDIKPMDKTSETLFALNPVTFRYKKEIDSAGTSQFGLVAEDVEKMNPDLVVRDKEGKPYSVRYDQVNAMLLNEFLKEHRKVEELGSNDRTPAKAN